VVVEGVVLHHEHDDVLDLRDGAGARWQVRIGAIPRAEAGADRAGRTAKRWDYRCQSRPGGGAFQHGPSRDRHLLNTSSPKVEEVVAA
jgi:hypothetical protein